MIHIFFMSCDIKNISINFKFNSRLYFLFQFTQGKTPMLSWRQIAAATYFHNRKRDTWVYFWRNTLNKSFRRNLSEWKRNCFFFRLYGKDHLAFCDAIRIMKNTTIPQRFADTMSHHPRFEDSFRWWDFTAMKLFRCVGQEECELVRVQDLRKSIHVVERNWRPISSMNDYIQQKEFG